MEIPSLIITFLDKSRREIYSFTYIEKNDEDILFDWKTLIKKLEESYIDYYKSRDWTKTPYDDYKKRYVRGLFYNQILNNLDDNNDFLDSISQEDTELLKTGLKKFVKLTPEISQNVIDMISFELVDGRYKYFFNEKYV